MFIGGVSWFSSFRDVLLCSVNSYIIFCVQYFSVKTLLTVFWYVYKW